MHSRTPYTRQDQEDYLDSPYFDVKFKKTQDIIHEQYRQRFYENRLESMESGKDSHHRRRSTYYG